MALRLSVVTPTYNRQASLERFLRSLDKQASSTASAFEVLVVDDGSTDETLATIDGLQVSYQLRLLRQAHQGPAQARNLGVSEASGELILFLDDDVVAEPTLLAQHLQSHAEQPNAVVIGPMLAPPGDWHRSAWVRWEELQLDKQYRDMVRGRYRCSPRQFYTGNASLERARFLAAGGFDARFKRAEDVELAYRLRDDGAHFMFNPTAAVHHYAERSFASWCRTPYQYGRYDVHMHRDKGNEALRCAATEFRNRHLLTRALVRATVGHRARQRLALSALQGAAQAADRLGVHGPALFALSAVFNVLYWQGVTDELGRPDLVRASLAAGALAAPLCS
jgi:glycosyltransferase involved in cell wall biosynthesis